MRSATPLVVAQSFPTLENHVEVFAASARLHQEFGGETDEVCAGNLTVLVSFDPPELARRSARMIAASFVAAACSFEQAPAGVDIGTWLAETLNNLPASSVALVIALPGYSPEIESQLGLFLGVVRSAGHHSVSLTVGVATEPADWARCDLDGFVLAEGKRDSHALQILRALAAVMAPVLLCPLDSDDFRCALGTAANPSLIAEAVFVFEDSRLLLASRRDTSLLADTVGVAFMPSRCLPLASLGRVIGAVRGSAKQDADVTVIATTGLTIEPLGSGGLVEVFLVCRTASSDCGQPRPNLETPAPTMGRLQRTAGVHRHRRSDLRDRGVVQWR